MQRLVFSLLYKTRLSAKKLVWQLARHYHVDGSQRKVSHGAKTM
jgi:hypothetical protein